MIIEFILSTCVVFALSWLCAIISGGALSNLIMLPEIPGIILILACSLILSGYGKAFCRIFCSRSKLNYSSALELKETENALSFACKALFYICLFFMLTGIMYYYLGMYDRNAQGPNLATVLLSGFYFLFALMILVTLKSKVKALIIKSMNGDAAAESSENSAGDGEPKASKKALKCLSYLFYAALIVFLCVIVAKTTIIKSQDRVANPFYPETFSDFMNLPAIIWLLPPVLALLAISGNLKLFFDAIKSAFANQQKTFAEKLLYINAVQTCRVLLISLGISSTLNGTVGALTNLENASMLGTNIFVALLPSFYALILCVLLLAVEARLNKAYAD